MTSINQRIASWILKALGVDVEDYLARTEKLLYPHKARTEHFFDVATKVDDLVKRVEKIESGLKLKGKKGETS